MDGSYESHGKRNHRAKEITWQRKSHGKRNIEVKSQQMAFTQSPSVSNNPKIPTYYLIFAETREITWQKDQWQGREGK